MKSKNYWTSGNAMSWALGVTLGVILGIALLIAIPRMMFPAASAGADAPQEPAAVASTADSSGGAESTEGQPAAATSSEEQTDTETAAEGQSPEPQAAAAEGEEGQNEGGAEAAEGTEAAAAVETGAGSAEAGATTYAGSCAGCHGTEGQGGVGPSLQAAAGWSDAEFTAALREGKTPEKELSPVMPRFTEAQLTAQQVADLHAHIKALY